jgi:Leucine-rich repeat (LRR) protein
LTQFSDDISSFLHLSELWIDKNKLNQFSSQLPPSLVRLYLYQNSITSISSTTLSSLTRLERLDLSDNQITILPTQIGLLTALQFLDPSQNQITILPTQIGLLTSLQHLNLNYNKLSFIPSDLNLLSNLTFLDVSSNNLTLIPIIQLHSVWQFRFYNNPLKFSPQPVGEKEFFEVDNDLYNQ